MSFDDILMSFWHHYDLLFSLGKFAQATPLDNLQLSHRTFKTITRYKHHQEDKQN